MSGISSVPIPIDHELQASIGYVKIINNIPRDGTSWERRVKEYLENDGAEIMRLEDKKNDPDFIYFCRTVAVFVECKLRKVPNAEGQVTDEGISKILKAWKRKQPKQFLKIKRLAHAAQIPVCMYLGLYDDKFKQGRLIILDLEPCKK